MIFLLASYVILNALYIVYSWGFVDANMPFVVPAVLRNFSYAHRYFSAGFHTIFVSALFILYGIVLYRVHKKTISFSWVKILIGSFLLLVLAFPSLSNDTFNYIATAKVAFYYKENPYIVMPIEIPNEPMVRFLHASNKIALYGPIWIILTLVPHVLGMGNLLITIFTFKSFVAFWYVFLLIGLWRLSGKSVWAIAFFGLNPLVVMETFIAGHNDVVMMALAVWSMYFFRRKYMMLSLVFFILSILIKYATLFLIPVWVYMYIKYHTSKKAKEMKMYTLAYWSMMVIFFLSPLREEIYPWYYIWPLVFASLLPVGSLEVFLSYGFSFGLLFRYAPFLLTREWGGFTPNIKKIVTFLPPLLASVFYVFKKEF